jgi:tetratricopeptide (TPR) repeat protein
VKAASTPADKPAKARYKGAPPFSDSPRDQVLFRGRDDEIEQLFHRVLGSPLILLFGTSGLGKTSLLQAGLFPRLRAKTFLPIAVRLNRPAAPQEAIISSVREACLKEGASLTEGNADGVWEYFQASLIWKDGLLQTPVLVFDQFEEVFTRQGQSFRTSLAAELGALASGIAPERLGAEAVRSARSRERSPAIKLVISLREDYLGALQEFSMVIPGLFRERVRLMPLSEAQAIKAICEPASLEADEAELEFFAPPFDYEPDALQAMLAFLKGKSQIIEPFQLQLLCSHLEERVAGRQAQYTARGLVTVADLGGVAGMERVQGQFYDRTIAALPGRMERQRARRLCEEGLLDTGGHRAMLEENQILSEYRLSLETLGCMVDQRLLQREQRFESCFYEICHDRLAETISHSRPWFRAIPRRVRQTALGGLAVGLLALGGLLYINRQLESARNEAVKQRQQAEAATADAEKLVGYLIGPLLDQVRPAGRNSVLEDVQTRVESYLNKTGHDLRPQATKNEGLARRNKGDLLLSQGHLREAIEQYHQSRVLFERLVKDEPSQNEWKAELARTLEKLGNALDDQGRYAKGLAAQDEALRLRQSLYDPAQTVSGAIDLTDSENGVAQSLTRIGRPVSALGHFDRAMALLKALQQKSPGDRRVLKARWECADGRAAALDYAGKPGGREEYKHGNTFAKVFLSNHPLAADAWQSWATAISRLPDQNESPAAAMRDYESVRRTFTDLVHWDESNANWRRELAATRLLECQELTDSSRFDQAKGCFDGVLKTFEELARIDSTDASRKLDLAWLHDSRGKLRQSAEDLAGGRKEFELAARLFEEGEGTELSVVRLKLLGTLQNLGELLIKQKDYQGAIETYQRGRRLAAELKAGMPEMATPVYSMLWLYDGELQALESKGNTAAAGKLRSEKERVLAAAIAERPGDPNLYDWRWVHKAGIGDRAKERKDTSAALAAYRDGLKDLGKAIQLDPGNPTFWAEDRNAHKRIAEVLLKSKDQHGAAAEYQKAAESGNRAANLAPDNASYQYWLYDVYYASGQMLRDSGDLDGALKEFTKSAEAARRASEMSPQNADYANRRFLALYETGRALQNKPGRDPSVVATDALQQYRSAEPAILKAISLEPRDATFTENRSQLYHRMAEVLSARRNWRPAEEAYLDAIAASEKAAALEPSNAERYGNLYAVHSANANLLRDKGDPDGALKEYRSAASAAEKAFQLKPSEARYANQQFLGFYSAGLILERQQVDSSSVTAKDVLQEYRKAEAPIQSALSLEPGNAIFAQNRSLLEQHIGSVLKSAKDWAAAEEAYGEALASAQKAVASDPKNASRYPQLYESYMAAGDLLRERDKKDLPAALKQYAEALRSLESAVRLNSSDPELASNIYSVHYRTAELREQMTDSAGAEMEYRSAAEAARTAFRLQASAEHANQEALALDRLGIALAARQDESGAVAAYTEGMKALEQAISLDSKNLTYQMNLGLIQARIGEAKKTMGDSAGAKSAYRDALITASWASEREPGNSFYRRQVYLIQWTLGRICEEGGEMQPAREYGYEALANARKAADRDSADSAIQYDVRNDIKELESWTRKMVSK